MSEIKTAKKGFLKSAVSAVGVAGTFALVSAPASAAGIDYAAFSTEIAASGVAIGAVITSIIVILAMLLGWSLFKKGAK